MEAHESRLLVAMKEMSSRLSECDSRWETMWHGAYEKGQQLFESDCDVREKYDFATKIRGYYGGMGSFNDIFIPDECEQLKTMLYKRINDSRRHYWQQLGFEWHEASLFEILPNGTKVKLIPGKVIYQDQEHTQYTVADSGQDVDEVWEVASYDGLDITNMPSYSLRSSSCQRSARQEAIEILIENKAKKEKTDWRTYVLYFVFGLGRAILHDAGISAPLSIIIAGSVAFLPSYWLPPRLEHSFWKHAVRLEYAIFGFVSAIYYLPALLDHKFPAWLTSGFFIFLFSITFYPLERAIGSELRITSFRKLLVYSLCGAVLVGGLKAFVFNSR